MTFRNAPYLLVVLALLVMAGFIYSQQQKGSGMQGNNKETFSREWEQVMQFQDQGLPQSALEVVEKIYREARKSGNRVQVVKAIGYRVSLKASFEEEPFFNLVNTLKAEIGESRFPEKAILQSMLAEAYYVYYQSQRYQILDRSSLINGPGEDARTWDPGTFFDRIREAYQASLERSDELQQFPLADFEPLLNVNTTARTLRPTLYDLLAHRALDYFLSSEPEVTRPANQFTVNDPAAFAPSETFVKADFSSSDSASHELQAVHILQELLRFHDRSDYPAARIDADLKRLQYMRDKAVDPRKSEHYREALEALLKAHEGQAVSVPVYTALAQFYQQEGQAYAPYQGDESLAKDHLKWYLQKARQLCQTAIERFPNAPQSANCRSLAAQLDQKNLGLTLESVNEPGEPFRALLTYQNVNKAWLRVVKLSPEAVIKKRYEEQLRHWDWVDFYRDQPRIQSWTVDLPVDGDLRLHKTEIALPELPNGFYAVLVASSADFSTNQEATGFAEFWASGMAMLYRQNQEDGENILTVYDRHSGAPLSGVKASIWYQDYDRGKRRNVLKTGPVLTSNAAGNIDLAPAGVANGNPRFMVDLKRGEERYFPWDMFSLGRPYRNLNRQVGRRAVFFTDRAIYRPGQTVYFKAILMENRPDAPALVTGHSTRVTLYDTNGQEVSALDLKSNDYGTISGSFVLPTGGLTGSFSLRNENGNASFRVEEYKRPRFEVTFPPVTGSFRLNEAVTVSGVAKSYAGANIDNARVRYRITRTVYYPYPFRGCWWGWWPQPSTVEILNGNTVSDAEGNFTIEFQALADPSIDPERQPAFNFSVEADVTDLAGETRSAQTSVRVGYVALEASLSIPAIIERGDAGSVGIVTRNLNGQFEAASGKVVIKPLKAPGRILRKRQWEVPDRFVMLKDAYVKQFPNDVYANEDDFRNWEAGAAVLQRDFDTGKSTELSLGGIGIWGEGHYVAELSTRDKFGTEIQQTHYFEVTASDEKNVPDNTLFWMGENPGTVVPGKSAVLQWGSASGGLDLFLEIFYRDGKRETRWLKGKSGKNRLEIPVAEKDRGGISARMTALRLGRVWQVDSRIHVPWDNKELKISYETFRDKLKPGAEEEWRLRISGPKGDALAAEMVATLYDASLDAFAPHSWFFNPYGAYSGAPVRGYNRPIGFGTDRADASGRDWNVYVNGYYINYESLAWQPGIYYGYGGGMVRRSRGASVMEMEADMAMPMMKSAAPAAEMAEGVVALADRADDGNLQSEVKEESQVQKPPTPGGKEDAPVQVRKNLVETAFFFPHLQTDEKGDVLLKFTMPEALTRWKFLGVAHTRDLSFAVTENSTVTQKELMVVPNAPRFLREGDRIVFSGKVSNLSEKALSGSAELLLFDALTMKPVDARLGNAKSARSFKVEAGQSAPLTWELKIPEGLQAVTYRIVARAGTFSDGEENALPVLTNRMLVTESLPLPVRGKGSKTFTLDKLLKSGDSQTLRHEAVTLEFTANPAWYAVQALPYLMEYPYECAEQVFNRYYANSLASHIVNSSPRIKAVFEQWQRSDSQELLSNLEKNQELKSLLLEETPWVMEARSESERKRRVGMLFDLMRMSNELSSALEKIYQMRLSSGAWPWFNGMRENRYITQYLFTGFGRLQHLGVNSAVDNARVNEMITGAMGYLDGEMDQDYQRLLQHKVKMDEMHIGPTQVQYLYARSFYADRELDKNYLVAFDYWKAQASRYWLKMDLFSQGMIALALHRWGDHETPAAIFRSLKERALHSGEMGMYWRSEAGYYWYQAPIETQAMLIEAFEEAANDRPAVEDMKVWLLKQKQTQDWKTTRATADAVYALLLRGMEILSDDAPVIVQVGNQTVRSDQLPEGQAEAGTGYFKQRWSGDAVSPEMGKVTVTKSSEGVAWGALYWQYFEQLDKITPHQTPLTLKKQLYVQRDSDSGPRLEAVGDKTVLKVGDLLKVRIELQVDRAMEFVHLKDMRASGLEPINVLSGYHYQDGLGYYESTRDAATNFFFDWLPKGTYVFEYPLRVFQEGDFSNGISSIQCMYAPEFTAHSEGIRIRVGQ